jgi:hypothetical protein
VNITLESPCSTVTLASTAPTTINMKPSQANFGAASRQLSRTAEAK